MFLHIYIVDSWSGELIDLSYFCMFIAGQQLQTSPPSVGVT